MKNSEASQPWNRSQPPPLWPLKRQSSFMARIDPSGAIAGGGVVFLRPQTQADTGSVATAITSSETFGTFVVGVLTNRLKKRIIGFYVAKFRPDGALDSAFGQSGIATFIEGEDINEIYLQFRIVHVTLNSTGQIYLCGTVTRQSANLAVCIRLTDTGSLDESFFEGGIYVNKDYRGSASAIAISPNDDVLLLCLSANPLKTQLTKFDANGGLLFIRDIAENFAGERFHRRASIPDRLLISAGESVGGKTNPAALLIDENGDLDTSFGSSGIARFEYNFGPISTASFAGENGFWASTSLERSSIAVSLHTANGGLDRSFSGDGKTAVSFPKRDASQAGIFEVDGTPYVAATLDDQPQTLRLRNDGAFEHFQTVQTWAQLDGSPMPTTARYFVTGATKVGAEIWMCGSSLEDWPR